MSATQAFITPAVLRWARERSGMSIDRLAKKINTNPIKLTAWEQGDERPSMRQAQHLAGALHVPFGYFFLAEVPKETIPIPDFRTHRNSTLRNPSPELIDVLHDVILKQEWYRDFLQQEGRQPLAFVGRFTVKSKPVDIAADITKTLKVDEERTGGWEDFLGNFIHRAEEQGVTVMRSGIVGSNSHRALATDEFRGFALSDTLAPIVFINSADYKAAQIFTLAHELAHIWIGESGVSNEFLGQATEEENATEKLCNEVAAEVLVPREAFLKAWSNVALEVNMRRIGSSFKVSPLVVLRRAFDLGKTTRKEYQSQYAAEVSKFAQRAEAASEGGNFFNTFFARNSLPFTEAVIGAVAEGRTMYREAARILNVKVPTIHRIAEQIAQKTT